MTSTLTQTTAGQAGAFSLTDRERDDLRLLLEGTLADLHAEIAPTDRYEFREGLEERPATLAGALGRLRALPSTLPKGHPEAP
jgi:hypothetical protein